MPEVRIHMDAVPLGRIHQRRPLLHDLRLDPDAVVAMNDTRPPAAPAIPAEAVDADVPADQQLACLLWKCWHHAAYGIGDGTITWWTLQPLERATWQKTVAAAAPHLAATTARERDEWDELHRLVDEAFRHRMNGDFESAWREWDRSAERLLRGLPYPERNQLQDRIDKVLAAHHGSFEDGCISCGVAYPCPTFQILTGQIARRFARDGAGDER